MPPPLHNRMSAVLTAEEMTSIRTDLKAIRAKLHFLVGLSAEEKRKLVGIDVSNKIFVEDCHRILQSNPEYAPSPTDLEEFGKDILLYNQLEETEIVLAEQLEKVRSSRLLAGAEAYRIARKVYAHVQDASKDGIPGAMAFYQQLKVRFEKKSAAAPDNSDN